MLKKMYQKIPVWAAYTILFMMIVAASFGILRVMGQSTIWDLDGIAQHYPILTEFYRILHGQGGQSLFSWSWNLGLGADQMTTFAYYVVGDPFSYLIALFPADQLELGYQLLTILRLYVVGLAFLALAKQLHFKRPGMLIGALIYTFNGYSFYVSYHHPFFLLPLIFFPLLCLCIDRIYKGKSFLPLALVTALALVCNVYFAYVLGLGALAFALIRYFDLRRKHALVRSFPKSLGYFAATIMMSLMMAGAILLPNILAMLNSSRTGGADFANGLSFYPPVYYTNLPNALLNTSGNIYYWAVLGTSGLTLLAMVWTFRRFTRYLWLNITLILIAIGLLFPAVAATLNVLSTPSNRWVLLAHLVFSLTAALFVDHLHTVTVKDYRWFILASALLLLLVWLGNDLTFNMPAHHFLAYGFLLLYVAILANGLLVPHRKRVLRYTLLAVVALNAASTGVGLYSSTYSHSAKDEIASGQPTRWTKTFYDYADRYLNKADKTFYRTNTTSDYYNTPTAGNNIPMLLNTHSISSYYSVQNGEINTFNKALQNLQNKMNNPTGEVDDRTTMNALLGVKYLFARQDELANHQAIPFGFTPVKTVSGKQASFPDQPVYTLGNGTGTVLMKSKYALPLAYMQYRQINQADFDKLSALDREQALLQGVEVANTVKKTQSVTPRQTSQNVDYTVKVLSQPMTTEQQVINYRLKKNVALSQSATVPGSNLSDKAAENYRSATGMQTPSQGVKNLLTKNQQILADNALKNKNGLTEMTSDVTGHQMTYQLKIKQPSQYRNSELYLAVDGIKTTQQSTPYRMQSFANNATLAGTPYPKGEQINNQRFINNSPTFGNYQLTVKTGRHQNSFSQLGVNNMSDYEPADHLLINLGYNPKTPSTVSLTFDTLQKLHFKNVKLIAVPFGSSFITAIKKLQNQGLTKLQVANNTVTGHVDNSQTGILTTSIPYSDGWKLTVDGRPTPTTLVNSGFVGAEIGSGSHEIRLTYETPGLQSGVFLTVLGLAFFLVVGLAQLIWPHLMTPKKSHQRKH
ncbi:integral membrane protein [Secundilactobacillus kimchicus JCM 15530]|uniref:Integral membrane protein n=2 Tax=Secundilactobacillus kimchicus TaxID=528209 RepID=A0A0R1HN61_9LACO|nr:integral membrane protein [Secundilactobacillus kimchicus JCM 15530]